MIPATYEFPVLCNCVECEQETIWWCSFINWDATKHSVLTLMECDICRSTMKVTFPETSYEILQQEISLPNPN